MALQTSVVSTPVDVTEISDAEMMALAENLNAIEPGAAEQSAYQAISVDFYVVLDVLAVISIWGLLTAIAVLSVPMVRQLYHLLMIRL